MAYHNRRVRNIDNWLQKKGYYRKVLPRDGHCIFRAASEQMYMTQVFHGYVRAECANYARKYPYPFQQCSAKDWNNYLLRLENSQVVCGQLEMRILSRKFKRDIIVFDSSNRSITNITRHHFKKQIRLCYVEPDHYDLVLTLELTNSAGFCQYPSSGNMADQYIPEETRNQEFWQALEQFNVEPMDTNNDFALDHNYINNVPEGNSNTTFDFANGEETQVQPVPTYSANSNADTTMDPNQNWLPPLVLGYGATNVYNPQHQIPPAHENYISCQMCFGCPHNVSVITRNMEQLHSPNIHQLHSPIMHQLHSPIMHQLHSPNIHQIHSPIMHQLHSPIMHQLHSPNMHQLHSPHMHQLHSPNIHQLHSNFTNGLNFMGQDENPMDIQMHNAIYSRLSTPGMAFPLMNTISHFPYAPSTFVPPPRYNGDYYLGIEPDHAYSINIYRERHTTLRIASQNSSQGAANTVQNEVNNNFTRDANFNIPTSAQHSASSRGADSTGNQSNKNRKKRKQNSN